MKKWNDVVSLVVALRKSLTLVRLVHIVHFFAYCDCIFYPNRAECVATYSSATLQLHAKNKKMLGVMTSTDSCIIY